MERPRSSITLANVDSTGDMVFEAAGNARAICGLAVCTMKVSAEVGESERRWEPHMCAGAPDNEYYVDTTQYTVNCKSGCQNTAFASLVTEKVRQAVPDYATGEPLSTKEREKALSFGPKPLTDFNAEQRRGSVIVNGAQQDYLTTFSGLSFGELVANLEQAQCAECTSNGCGFTAEIDPDPYESSDQIIRTSCTRKNCTEPDRVAVAHSKIARFVEDSAKFASEAQAIAAEVDAKYQLERAQLTAAEATIKDQHAAIEETVASTKQRRISDLVNEALQASGLPIAQV